MHLAIPVFGDLGWPELLIIVLVLLLLFGGRKLPEVARGTGRALRIFKAETRGLMSDDDDDDAASTPRSSGQLPPSSQSSDPSQSGQPIPPGYQAPPTPPNIGRSSGSDQRRDTDY